MKMSKLAQPSLIAMDQTLTTQLRQSEEIIRRAILQSTESRMLVRIRGGGQMYAVQPAASQGARGVPPR